MTVKTEAASDADRILTTLWDDTIPVDPVRIARQLGINVLDARLGPDVAGALIKNPGQDPAIVLSSADSSHRKRFSCAHEIGHFLRRSDTPEEYRYIDFRRSRSRGDDLEEVYANAFAACLLMPEGAVRRLHGDDPSDVTLAVRFGVSREAMQYRLRDLGLA